MNIKAVMVEKIEEAIITISGDSACTFLWGEIEMPDELKSAIVQKSERVF